MKTMKKSRFVKVLALMLVLTMLAGFAGCTGGGEEAPSEAGGRTVIYYAASYVTAQVQDAYKEMVKTYNET